MPTYLDNEIQHFNSERMQQKAPKILVVDDNTPIRLTLRKGLSKAGYEVYEASDGEQGYELFFSRSPDIVLMDVQMPVINGFETVQKIRKKEKSRATPILMLTADDDVDSIRHAFDSGATDYITKPINLPLLLLRLQFALRDIEREQILDRTEQQKENARQLFGLVYWEINSRTEQVSLTNSDIKTLSWLSPPPTSLAKFTEFIQPQERDRFLSDMRSAIDNNRPFDLNVSCKANDGIHFVRIVGQQDDDGNFITGALQDITGQKELEDRTSYLNYYDQVTGLANQKLFLSSLEKSIQQSLELNLKIVVLVIELQNLNAITNAYGNTITETLQSRVAAEIKNLISQNALFAKLDGGFFAVQLRFDRTKTLEKIVQTLNQELSKIRKSWFINGKEIFVKYAAGIAENKEDGSTPPSTLLRMAKSAQLKAHSGKDVNIAKYDAKVNTAMKNRLNLEAELNKALENKEFKLQYQPQLCLQTGKIVGAEALLRWHSNDRGFVSPAEFIPVLEETGLINNISDTIISKACKQQLDWQLDGLDLTVGINLSAIQFQINDLSNRICSITKSLGVDNRKIELEVTESATMDDPQRTMHILHKLREAGFKIALDDFGTGYSSFEYLLNFELDKIKIDRAFITNITKNRKDRALVKAISSLSEGLNVKTIAEGVENNRQLDYLDALGIQELQGFFISKPLWPDELYQFAVEFNQGRRMLNT